MAIYILGNYKYVLNDNDYTASVYNNTTALSTYEEITNPIVYNGNTYTVVSMARCFSNCTSLTQAPVIPSTVTNVNLCFSNCSSLTQAPAIPTGVTNMSSCFDRCTSLTQAPAIPSSVTNIEYCFNGCTSLTQAPEMPINITSMKSCFQGCTSLTQAPEIPSGVTNMQYCFYGCTSLTGSITVNNNPSSYSNIFNGTTESIKIFCIGGDSSSDSTWSNIAGNYNNITTPADVSGEVFYHGDYKYTVNSGSAINKTGRVQAKDKTKTEYGAIETDIKVNHNIGSGNIIDVTDMTSCFYGCGSLTQAPVIPSSVTSMLSCFYECGSLTQAPEIPSSVTNMTYCFYKCGSLTQAPVIPSSVTTLSVCFYGCGALAQAPVIPSSVTNMNACFEDCISITQAPEIPIGVTNMRFCFYGCTSLLQAPVIPSSVTNMEYCFKGCTSLTQAPAIPSSVTNIGFCFQECRRLTQAPNFETPIGFSSMSYCFEGCSSLIQAPIIPSGVKGMGSCFAGCTSLAQAPEIPNSVTYLNNTFAVCTSLLQAPVIPSGVTDMTSCFQNCRSLTQAPEIPSGVTRMASCFYDCTSLTGNIIVNNKTDYFTQCFTRTTLPIYIINNSSISGSDTTWRSIASEYANVHYEGEDATVPQLSLSKLLRTNALYEEEMNVGTYLYISLFFKIYQGGNIPSGWKIRAKASNNKELYIDSTDKTSYTTWTENSEDTNTFRIKGWYDTSDDNQHSVEPRIYYEIVDEDDNVRNTLYVSISSILASSRPLVSYRAGAKGIALGGFCPDDGFHVKMDAIFYENVIFKKMAGVIQMFAGSTAPSGWLLCDGSEYLKTDYPLLYAVIGDAYGDTTKGAVAPSDSDHFRVPDFRGRTGIGTGNGTATGHTDHTIGKLGGNEDAITPYHDHTVTATQSGVSITGGGHSHKLRVHADTVASGTKYDRPNSWASGQAEGYTSSNVTHTHTLPAHTHTISSAGTNGNATGANMPPYLTINYIIATGRFE